jgi:RNA 2',3'-cyclic 3'-phosphodiesterase
MVNLRPVELDSPLNRRVRVFLGIGPAPTDWAEPLSLWVTQLNRRVPSVRWTNPANLHLTLRFFGTVTQGVVLQINEAVSEIVSKHTAFTLESIDLALFPDPTHPRIAAVKLRDQTGELASLEAAVRDQTAKYGQEPERRDFTPHVTFGRLKDNDWRARKIIGEIWREHGMPELPDWNVTGVKLFLSEPGPGGSVYIPLETFSLGN